MAFRIDKAKSSGCSVTPMAGPASARTGVPLNYGGAVMAALEVSV
jgi:hypothetical protein